jgi:hypothetical protein
MSRAEIGRPISRTVILELICEKNRVEPILGVLGYDPADPYAVSLDLHMDSGPLRWVFARDLLLDGFYQPTGLGDVHVFPCVDEQGRAVVVLCLESPDGSAFLQINSCGVASFINEMLAIVERGRESDLVDFDAAIAELFGDVRPIR